jgi:hypothetical protein
MPDYQQSPVSTQPPTPEHQYQWSIQFYHQVRLADVATIEEPATWRCGRCDMILYFLRLFSVNSYPKITRLFCWILSTLYHHASSPKFSISHPAVFRMKKSAWHRYRQCFLLGKSCRKMYTILLAVLRQQSKSHDMTYFGNFTWNHGRWKVPERNFVHGRSVQLWNGRRTLDIFSSP